MSTVYHGSNIIVKVPNLQRCRELNDFGKAFYVNTQKGPAKKQAVRAVRRPPISGKPYISEYDCSIPTTSTPTIKVLKSYLDPEWLDMIINCRSGHDIYAYEVVIGPITDDAATNSVNQYLSGSIDRNELLHKLTPKGVNKSANQLAFRTQSAIDKYLKFKKSLLVESILGKTMITESNIRLSACNRSYVIDQVVTILHYVYKLTYDQALYTVINSSTYEQVCTKSVQELHNLSMSDIADQIMLEIIGK